MRVLIIGAGGHAQVIADVLLREQEQGVPIQPVGYLDDNPALVGQSSLSLPVLGSIACLPVIDHDAVVVAIGDNRTRARIFRSLRAQGEQVVSVIHPAAVLTPDVRLGEGVMICAGAVVNTGTVIGDNVILNTGCTVDHHSRVEAHAHVAPGVHLGGNVHVSEGAFVGIGTAVIPGRSIGEWAVIGAGSSVIKDIPPFTTAVGVPAQVIKWREPINRRHDQADLHSLP